MVVVLLLKFLVYLVGVRLFLGLIRFVEIGCLGIGLGELFGCC